MTAARIMLEADLDVFTNPFDGIDQPGEGTMGAPYRSLSYALHALQARCDLGAYNVNVYAAVNNAQAVYDGVYLAGPWVGAANGPSQVKVLNSDGVFNPDGSPAHSFASNSTIIRPTSTNALALYDRATLASCGIMFDMVNAPGSDSVAVTGDAKLDFYGGRWEHVGSLDNQVANMLTADQGGKIIIQPGDYYSLGNRVQALSFSSQGGTIYANTNGVPGLVNFQFLGPLIVTQGLITVVGGGRGSWEKINWINKDQVTGPRASGVGGGWIDTGPSDGIGTLPGTTNGSIDQWTAYR